MTSDLPQSLQGINKISHDDDDCYTVLSIGLGNNGSVASRMVSLKASVAVWPRYYMTSGFMCFVFLL